MGTRLAEIIFDRHEDFLYEDNRAMKLTPYVMAERCLQVEIANIRLEGQEGDYSTLTYILEGGFRGFHKMSSGELWSEWKDGAEAKWFEMYDDKSLPWATYDEDPTEMEAEAKEAEAHPG